jgi:glutaminyl-tRNA synthetase
MRFDDTNPDKENQEYIDSILTDVNWLLQQQTSLDANFRPWNGPVRHASDYFDAIYESAVYLITNGLAYVDDLTQGNQSFQCLINLIFLLNRRVTFAVLSWYND